MDFPQITTTTSFIPKTKLTTATYPKRGLGLGFFISFFILLLSGGLFGGVYLYKSSLQKEVSDMVASLEKAKKAFEPSLIVELEKFTSSINNAKNLFNQHRDISKIFKLINDLTLKDVNFSDFKYNVDDKTALLIMSGEAKSYTTIALQAKLLENSDFIDRVLFSNFSLKEGGKVSFGVEINFKSSYLFYKP
jgi:D-ribose pyranose/furanose isomerase RbsD